MESQRISPKIGSGQNLTKCVLCEKLDGDYIGRNIDDLHSHASVHQRSMRIMAGNSKSLLFDSVFALCFPEYSKTIDNSYRYFLLISRVHDFDLLSIKLSYVHVSSIICPVTF